MGVRWNDGDRVGFHMTPRMGPTKAGEGTIVGTRDGEKWVAVKPDDNPGLKLWLRPSEVWELEDAAQE